MPPHQTDILIIGAGAAGLMCAGVAAQRGRRVVVLDHAAKIGEKIRISGGGRCNFTNLHTKPENFLSQNPHFCRSALAQYTPQDFIAQVEKHGIQWHEKKLGQLFCDDSAQQIIDMLLAECRAGGAEIRTQTAITDIRHDGTHYLVETSGGAWQSQSLVIATGGLSIPKIGATPFGYKIAEQFGLPIIPPRAGLVPLTFQDALRDRCSALSGLSVEASVRCGKTTFAEGLLFTHRGLSGPSILQISSYWREGEAITINLAPHVEMLDFLKDRKQNHPKQILVNAVAEVLPKRLAQSICETEGLQGTLAELSHAGLQIIAQAVNAWQVVPSGTEGYRTAEVTLGGVDTRALSSKTMAAAAQPHLYFIGEVVDVTGHLGGFNFQWAWSSGVAAGKVA